MKGVIALPFGHRFTMPNKSVKSFVDLCMGLSELYDFEILYNEVSTLEDARNALLKNCDWLLMLDSDMTYKPEDGIKLINQVLEGKDMVSGLYFMGYPPYNPCIYDLKVLDAYINYPKDKIFEIAYCGLGFCAISGKVIKALDNKPFTRLERTSGQLLEPDLSFCHRVRQKGFKIWCDSTIKLGHLRMFEINEQLKPDK